VIGLGQAPPGPGTMSRWFHPRKHADLRHPSVMARVSQQVPRYAQPSHFLGVEDVSCTVHIQAGGGD
jgi:hypothetical protein